MAYGIAALLLGPAAGALLIGFAETLLSEAFPGSWSYFQGALFVLVILLLPGRLAQMLGLVGRLNAARSSASPAARC